MSSNTALLVIDARIGLVEAVFDGLAVMERIVDVVKKARNSSVPVIFIQHDGDEGDLEPGAPGWHLHPLLSPMKQEVILHKRASDSFYRTPLLGVLTSNGIEHIVVVGFRTEMCIDTTCRQATSLGFDVTLVVDAHSTCHNGEFSAEQIIAHHNITLDDFGNDEHCIVTKRSNDISFV